MFFRATGDMTMGTCLHPFEILIPEMLISPKSGSGVQSFFPLYNKR